MRIEVVPPFTVSQEQTRLPVPLVLVRDLLSGITALEAKALKAQQAQTAQTIQNQIK